MSRSGYSDECDDQWQMICWRGAVKSAIKGARGQAFLKELAAAMDAMPEKRLTTHALQADGKFCALGVIGQARGMDLSKFKAEDGEEWEAGQWGQLSKEFGIAEAMVREIMHHNDEGIWHRWDDGADHGPARWKYMRDWIDRKLAESRTTSAQNSG